MMTPKTHQSSKLKNKIPLVEAKVSKVSGVGKQREPLKKDLIAKVDSLEKKIEYLEKRNETLEATNSENIEIIKCLQTKIENTHKNRITCSKETQTERGIELKCTECNFQATSSSELSWHLCENHGWSEDHDLDLSTGPRYCDKCDFEAANGYEMDGHMWSEHEEEDERSYNCQYCDENFVILQDLMYHKKTEHVEKVSSCWFFMNDSCTYGEDKCWFSHKRNDSQADQNSSNCYVCGKSFSTTTLFMKHMKAEHHEKVKDCKKYKEGKCSFYENCWFKHEALDKEENQKNEEVKNENSQGNEHLNNKENVSHDKTIQKLMDIVEKFTKRVVGVEEIVLKK